MPDPERRLVVDRFEGDLAVAADEAGRFLDLPAWLLPAGTREGDVVTVRREGEGEAARVELQVDRAAAEAAREEAAGLLARLRRGGPA
ncbi:MAG TPA: DUF3006 domain-containing protein [Longimicrobiaceae bacterium]|nr:DUF3006 domain-containing protein [Longimicrobiaceae bacterium]